MRVVALISGGKDSCYNMMKCVAAGHQIVALANLQPDKQDELDSFMFQTVGHEGISLIAESMGIPLYRAITRGDSLTRALQYSPTDGDEVEDLYELLVKVCEACDGVEGVSSGAVLSDYQRLRVENVCSRLGLVSLSYLWRRDQTELLREMIKNGVKAIIIKVASMGLSPDKHLGKTIEEMYSELCRLNSEFGVNVCGEGGEYETFTLDCPIYKKRIQLLDSKIVIHSPDPFAQVGYLKLTQLQLEDKPETALSASIISKRSLVPPVLPNLSLSGNRQSQCVRNGLYMWLAYDSNRGITTASDQTRQLFTEIGSCLSESGCGWRDVTLVYLYLSNMADYPAVNSVYKQFFLREPPARVCVSTTLAEGLLVRVEMLVCRCDGVEGGGRRSMHVQSHSEWAPANIGPYSQAYTVSGVVHCAGQIGLQPASMTLVNPEEQPSLSLTHVQTVLTACRSKLTSTLCGLCYYTSSQSGWCAKKTWGKAVGELGLSPDCPMAFLPVVSLPRGACVEWHFVAMAIPSDVKYSKYIFMDDNLGHCTLLEAINNENSVGCWTLTVETTSSVTVAKKGSHKQTLEVILRHLAEAVSRNHLVLSDMSFVRVCVPRFGFLEANNTQDIVQLCGGLGDGREVPVSHVVTEGYFGHNGSMIVQACKFHTFT